MLVVASDIHSTDGHRLTDRTLDVIREADLVVHAGNLTRESVLDALVDEADSFPVVHGDNGGSEIRDRVSAVRNAIYGSVEFAMMHTRRGRNTMLSMFGREHGADAVVFGHSHRSGSHDIRPIPLLNPGSHAQPWGDHEAHAEPEELSDGGLHGRLVTVDGKMFETFRIVPGE